VRASAVLGVAFVELGEGSARQVIQSNAGRPDIPAPRWCRCLANVHFSFGRPRAGPLDARTRARPPGEGRRADGGGR
jgi:hypothetical protein